MLSRSVYQICLGSKGTVHGGHGELKMYIKFNFKNGEELCQFQNANLPWLGILAKKN